MPSCGIKASGPSLRVSPSAVRVCRFWPEGRVRLWEEKLQLRRPFAGNAATQWGTVQEDVALNCYMEVCTHLYFILRAVPCRAGAWICCE